MFEDEYGEADDWIELFNEGEESIYLDELYFTDDFSDPLKWKLVGPYLLKPGGYFILWMDNDPEQGALHASFKLKSGGEQVGMSQLVNDEVIWLDSITFEAVPGGTSYGRINDGSEVLALLAEATPGASNSLSGLYLPAPLIMPPGGILKSPLSISISAPDTACLVYYTLDGSEPTESSLPYTATIRIDSALQLTAKAFKPGYQGASSRESYLLKSKGFLPLLSLELADRDLFDTESGIYVRGNNGITGHCVDYEANWNRDWEKRGRISLFEPNGAGSFRENVGIKIGGGCSRGLNMKGFTLFFRSKYGNPQFNYTVFKNPDVPNYHRLKIRNGGDDFQSMMFRDGLNQLLLRGKVDLDLMDYRPAVLFINSRFWGIYGLREHFNQDYILSHHGYREEEIDFIKNPFSVWNDVKIGNDSAFRELFSYIEDHDLSVDENYQFVSSQIDINEYLNYHISEIYLANYDWPAINNAIWKPKDGGKWRWMLYDTDGSTNFDTYFETNPAYNSLEHATQPLFETWPNSEASTLFLRKMLENKEFRAEFIQRTCTYKELIFDPERVERFTDSIADLLDPYVDQHLELWGENIPELGWGRSMGGSRAAWEENQEAYKSFFRERPTHMYQHLSSYFGLEGTFDLSLDHPPGTPGEIMIHSNQMRLPYQYKGTYCKNIPIKLVAIPNEGYEFLYWKESGETNPSLYFSSEEDTTLTPVFTSGTSIRQEHSPRFKIYPNPTKGSLHLLNLNGSVGMSRIRIVNTYGQILKEISWSNEFSQMPKTIELSTFSDGMYVIIISTDNKEYMEKIILRK